MLAATDALAGVIGFGSTAAHYCNRKDCSEQFRRFHDSSPVNVKILVFTKKELDLIVNEQSHFALTSGKYDNNTILLRMVK